MSRRVPAPYLHDGGGDALSRLQLKSAHRLRMIEAADHPARMSGSSSGQRRPGSGHGIASTRLRVTNPASGVSSGIFVHRDYPAVLLRSESEISTQLKPSASDAIGGTNHSTLPEALGGRSEEI